MKPERKPCGTRSPRETARRELPSTAATEMIIRRKEKELERKEERTRVRKRPMGKRTRNRAGSTTPLGVAPAVRSALFLHEGPGGSQRGAGPGLQLPNVSDLSGVGGKGTASMAKENPFMSCFDTAVLEDGQPKVQDPVWTTKALKQPGWKEKKGSRNNRAGNNHRGKPLHDLESWSELTSLDQLPKKWWKPTENSKGGYQYQTEVKILGRYVGCLLDGCAGCNSVTEELVVGAIKAALKDSISTDSSKFPVAQLECWPKEEVVMGLANGAPINLKGAAVIRVTFPEVTGKKDREILVRAKIIAKGCSTWQGLILGGRALHAVERGGLGFRPGANAHIFDALGARLPRKEETEEYAEHAYPHVAVQKSLFERAWDKESEVRGSFDVLWQGALGW